VNFSYSLSYSKMPSGQCSSRRLDDPLRLTTRDDKMWARKVEWAQHHGMTIMKCPCNRCAGKVKLVLLATIRGHLILNGKHPLFRVWKGPCPLDDYDEEWAATSRISTQTPMQPVEEGVHVGQLLEDLFPSANVEQVGMEEAALNLNSGEDGVRGLGMVHKVCEIMEELSTVLDSMAAHGDLNAKEDTRNNDEVFVADDHNDVTSEVQHLRESCQPLYKGAKSSMLAATLFLMNVCMVHGVSNKFVDELLALLHKHLLPLDNCLPPTSMHVLMVMYCFVSNTRHWIPVRNVGLHDLRNMDNPVWQ
jgi:hypothetical protein